MPDVRNFLKFNVDGALTTGSVDKVVFPVAGEVVAVSAAVGTPPTDASLVVDVSVGTTSVYSRGAVTGLATGDVLSVPTAHGLVVGDKVRLGAVTSLTGLTAIEYWVVAVPTARSLQVSATKTGTAINITADGTALALYKVSDLPTVVATASNSNAASVNGVVPQPATPVNTKFAAGDTLFLSVLQVGSTTAGSDLDVTVEYIIS